jgi:hypothetical protein
MNQKTNYDTQDVKHFIKKLKILFGKNDKPVISDMLMKKESLEKAMSKAITDKNKNGLYIKKDEQIKLLLLLKEILKIVDGVDSNG